MDGDRLRVIATITISVLLFGSILAAGVGTVSAERYNDFSEPTLNPSIQGENVVSPGETKRFDLTVQNRHQGTTEADQDIDGISQVIQSHRVAIGAASATTASFESTDAPFDIRTGAQNLGTIEAGSSRSSSLTVEVNEGAEPGTYRVPVTLEYEYVHTIIVDNDGYIINRNTETVTEYVTVRVEKDARLNIEAVTSDGVYPNADGTVTATVRNTGTETARDATLVMRESKYFQPRSSGVSIGRLEPGESATATFQTKTGDIDEAGNYSANFQLHYDDENGNTAQSAVRTGSVPVSEGPAFELSAETEALYVDSVGAVSVTVTNTGDRTATDARAILQPLEPFTLLSTQASLGTLEPGESATATFKLEASDRTVPQTYPLTFAIAHDDEYGSRVASDEKTVSAEVGPEKDFTVVETTTLESGSTETVELTVENTGGGPLTDAEIRINTNSPFSTDDDTAYVGTLEPGETTTAEFTVTTDGSATPKTYSLDTTIKHDNAFGNTVVTDIETAPVTVTSPEGRLTGIIALIVILGLLVGFGIAYRDQIRSRVR